MAFRKTFNWVIVFLLLATAGGGSYVYHLWEKQDEFFRQKILSVLQEKLPHWEIEVGHARYNWNGQVHAWQINISAPGQTSPVVTARELICQIDHRLLVEEEKVSVQRVEVIGPSLNLVRAVEGDWNWEALLPLPKFDPRASVPSVEIRQAEVAVKFLRPGGQAPGTIEVERADVQLIPAARRQFVIRGLTEVTAAGPLSIDGRINLDTREWELSGRIRQVTTSGEILTMASAVSPELTANLNRVDAALKTAAGLPPADPVMTATADNPFSLAKRRTAERELPGSSGHVPSPPAGTLPPIPDLGVSGTFDIGFQIAQQGPGHEPDFQLDVDVQQAQISNAALPFPLRDITGQVDWNNDRAILRNLTAKNGVTNLYVNGTVQRGPVGVPCRFDVVAINMLLDERLRNRLPPGLRRSWDLLQPGGMVDVKTTISHDGQGQWRYTDLTAALKGCTAAHVKFPYPVRDVRGTLRQNGQDLVVVLAGCAGQQPARLEGFIRGRDTEAEFAFDIRVDKLPVDQTLLKACTPQMRKTLDALNLTGQADVQYRVYRPAGPRKKVEFSLATSVENGSMEFRAFPYRIDRLSGNVTFDSVSRRWSFERLRGEHGQTRLAGRGSFDSLQPPGQLQLAIDVQGVPLDDALHRALTDELRSLWKLIHPTGTADAGVNIAWQPGSPPEVTLPRARIHDGSILLSCMPYAIEEVEAELAQTDGYVELKSFAGKHDQTAFRGKGFVQYNRKRDWRVRVTEMFVDDLIPDRSFRRTLPQDIRSIVEELDPDGPLSLSGMFELRGSGAAEDPVTAAWDVDMVCAGTTWKGGIELHNVHGHATSRGTWDGEQAHLGGTVDFDSMEVWGYQLTQVRGPYRIKHHELVLGSKAALQPVAPQEQPDSIELKDRVTAQFLGGIITWDLVGDLSGRMPYHLKMTFNHGRLEEYARRYLPGIKNLRGLVNGWIELHGEGDRTDKLTGRGQVQISPAALYETPMMVQIFQVLSLGSPDKTAFHTAFADFQVRQEQFLFDTIDFVGETISLRGRGTARFDGRLHLDFYSMLSRSRVPVPILRDLIGQATAGWVGIEVRGKVDDPVARVRQVPQLDDTLKRFLDAFGTQPMRAVPRLLIQPLSPMQTVPPPRQPQSPFRNTSVPRRGIPGR